MICYHCFTEDESYPCPNCQSPMIEIEELVKEINWEAAVKEYEHMDNLTEKDFPQDGKAWVKYCGDKSKRIKNFIKKYKNG